VVEGGREDGSEYAMEVGLRERHSDSAEVALRRGDTSLSSRRDSSLCRCWLRGRLGGLFAMDGLAALGCCFPAEMFHLFFMSSCQVEWCRQGLRCPSCAVLFFWISLARYRLHIRPSVSVRCLHQACSVRHGC
jgi:hypothetical protein